MNIHSIIKIALISIVLISCKKENEKQSIGGYTTVQLSLSNSSSLQNTATVLSEDILNSNTNEQKIITKLNDDINLVAKLTTLETSPQEKSAIDSSIETISKELKENTKIKILVYDSKGNKFTEIDYTYKRNNQTDIKIENLIIGDTYTFIAYSINSIDNIPEPINKENLNNLKINDLTTEFIYFKEVRAISQGQNSINIILKHQFSEVTTYLEIDQKGIYAGSKVTQMTAPTISPAYSKASYNLAIGSPIFEQSELIQNGKALPINSANGLQSPIITDPVLIMTDASDSKLLINSITINGSTHSAILSGFKIKPGVKYRLMLEASCPCVKDVTPTLAISLNKTSDFVEYNYDGANYGIVFDIYKLDNSFNMTINEKPIFKGNGYYDAEKTRPVPGYLMNEINFEGYEATGWFNTPLTSPIPNIEFEDESRWAMNGVKKIWELDGRSTSKPIIRVVIDKNGDTKMYGSKLANGGEPFYLLRLLNNERTAQLRSNGNFYVIGEFQKNITWNEGINKIKISQSKIGNDTNLTGYITGRKTINCNEVN